MFLSAEELEARVRELGAQIAEDYTGKDLLLIALLKASFVFLTDLSRAIPTSHKVDFVELADAGLQLLGCEKDLAYTRIADYDARSRR